jgi:hypothetical protein
MFGLGHLTFTLNLDAALSALIVSAAYVTVLAILQRAERSL